MLPHSDCLGSGHRLKCLWQVFLHCFECVGAVVTLELLDHAPEIFDEVKLAVELGEEDAEVTTGFDDFLSSRPQIGHCHKVVFSKCRAP